MKVILAGYSKTGTTSMAAALTELGYTVHDFGEHVLFFGKEWTKILLHGVEKEDFIKMYEDVDAVGDGPVFQYWYQIHQAFPEAKIILTTRDEDSFIASYAKELKEQFGNHIFYKILQTFTPTGRTYFQVANEQYKTSIAMFARSPWDKVELNKIATRRLYRMHNQDVISAYCYDPIEYNLRYEEAQWFGYVKHQHLASDTFYLFFVGSLWLSLLSYQTKDNKENAPKDKLLVFNVREGWEKLCKFLNKDIPDVPFPHKNSRSANIEGRIKTHPLFQKMKMVYFWTLET